MKLKTERMIGLITKTVGLIVVIAILIAITFNFKRIITWIDNRSLGGRYEVLENTWNSRTLMDKETGVLYLEFNGSITPLLNADGSPKTVEDLK